MGKFEVIDTYAIDFHWFSVSAFNDLPSFLLFLYLLQSIENKIVSTKVLLFNFTISYGSCIYLEIILFHFSTDSEKVDSNEIVCWRENTMLLIRLLFIYILDEMSVYFSYPFLIKLTKKQFTEAASKCEIRSLAERNNISVVRKKPKMREKRRPTGLR